MFENPIEELISYAKRAIRHLGTSPEARMGLRTGLGRLDDMIRGLHWGKLYVVAGRPGDGKTSFGTTLTANVMLQRDFPVLYISTELEEEEIMLQIAEAYTGIPVYPNRRTSTADEQATLKATLMELVKQEEYGLLNVVHQKSITTSDVKGWISLLRPEDDDPRELLVIIDQASRIKRDDANGRRQYTLATEDMLNELEAVGHETRAAVVLLTQMNRQAEHQQRPMLSNLKHSGAFEEFAHCVLLLEKLEGNGMKEVGSGYVHHDAIIHVAKNRHGHVGAIDANFEGEIHHWTERKPRPKMPERYLNGRSG